MSLFKKNTQSPNTIGSDFHYLDPSNGYFDSACQTLRPQQVVDALNEYYREYNACGGRVKYAWGKRVDEEIETTRKKVLDLLDKDGRHYECSFTLNTTYGLNLILSQIKDGQYSGVVTSEIEHNSVFLPTMTLAKRLGVARTVLERDDDGSVIFEPKQLEKSIVVINSSSNIDGRQLKNLKELCAQTHKRGGIVIVDAAQTMGHDRTVLEGADYDAICFSSHKMYGPSLGVIVAKKTLIEDLDFHFVGGGMVEDVTKDDYVLTNGDLPSRFEPGLQDFGGIIALSAAIDWMQSYRPGGKSQDVYKKELQQQLYDGLKVMDGLVLMNNEPSSVVSFYSDKIDAHRMAVFLSEQNIMVRSGYFCVHYYLIHKRKLPPLLRVSLGLNNTPEQVDRLLDTLKIILRNVK